MSKKLVRAGFKQVVLDVPREVRVTTMPGLFGCPSKVGQAGDDHWQIVEGPIPVGSDRLQLRLQRLDAPGSAREHRKAVLRQEGSHLLAYAERVGHKFAGIVIGYYRDAEGKKHSVQGYRLIGWNQATAVAKTLAAALDEIPWMTNPTIWTDESLIGAAMRGHYLDARRSPYKGTKAADLDDALGRLRKAALGRPEAFTIRSCKKRGATWRELVGAAIGMAANEPADVAVIEEVNEAIGHALDVDEINRQFPSA